jgi:TetR/AcrR family transcriptional regulator, transcriptional repressor for nem operon
MSMKTQQSKNTRQSILDTAEALILTRGYNGFSYKDIADVVGIRKASIHYHFPTKEELGTAFVDGYFQRFVQWRAHVDPLTFDQKLAAFEEMLYRVSNNAEKICPMGMLTAEYPTLPASMQDSLRRLLGAMDRWLAQVLAQGQAEGLIRSEPEAPIMAKVMFNALSGSMKMARVFQDVGLLDQVFRAMKSLFCLGSDPALKDPTLRNKLA